MHSKHINNDTEQTVKSQIKSSSLNPPPTEIMKLKSCKPLWKVLFLTNALLLMLQIELSCSTTSCLDMVVAVDTSSSCTQAEFNKLISQVKAIVAKFQVGPGKTRLALIGMSQSAQVLANFNDVSSLSDFNSAVDRLSLTSERTEISKGMKLARESVLNTARSAPVPKLLVLVKDRRCSARAMGSSDSELALIKSEANAVRSMGGTVHAVGIGGLWNSQELNALFGTDYLLFINRNKAMDSIKSLNKICPPTNCKNAGQNFKQETCFGYLQHVFKIGIAGAITDTGVGVCREEITRLFQSCTEKQSCNKMDRSLGSCQADGNLEIVETLQFFNRKKQSCVTDKENKKVDCSQAKKCKNQVADLFIMLDRSGSLRAKYGTLVDAAVELVKYLKLGPNNVRIGVVSFSGLNAGGMHQETIITAVNFGEVFDNAEAIKKIKGMVKDGNFESTFTGDGLKKVGAILKSKGRQGVFKAIIIITDGRSSDQDVLFDAVSELKKSEVTIFAIGVKPKHWSLNMDELKTITSPETDKNLFILENFEQLKPWAKKFPTRLCMELKPLNPKLCDAHVQFKSISPCLQKKMQTTLVKFEYDAAKKCIKHYEHKVINQCKAVCVDPIDGSEYLEGESWVNLCHNLRCDKDGKLTLPTKAGKCVAADLSCKAIGSAPFQCRNSDGEVKENCQCVDKSGMAVLVIDNPN